MAGIEENATKSTAGAVTGAAPSVIYTITLALLFGVALIATAKFAPLLQRAQLQCDLPPEPDTLVITVDRRGDKIIARCVPVSSRGSYTAKGRP